MRKKKGASTTEDAIRSMLDELGTEPSEWSIDIDFTKGTLSGIRGAVVEVQYHKTGEKRRMLAKARTKAEIRKNAIQLARSAVLEMK